MNRNCTPRRIAGKPRWGNLVGGVALAIAFVLSGQPGTRADTEIEHVGDTGRHRLADIYDSPGAVCDVVLPGNDSLGETWLRVNPPIMFAWDSTAAEDYQDVGWRAIVYVIDPETDTRRMVRQSEIARDYASDNLASYFSGQGWLAEFPVSRATYEVEVEMYWYDPDHPSLVEGRAVHGVEYFLMVLRHHGEAWTSRTAQTSCRAPR